MSERSVFLGAYRRLGIATVPLRARSKRPLRRNWQRADESAWENVPADANVGVLAGAPSGGLVVLDFDSPDLFVEELGMSPSSLSEHTVVVRSARGYHVYAYAPGLPTRVPREGFSILSDGSLAVAPPSVHASGARYKFVGEPRRIALLSEFAVPAMLAGPVAISSAALSKETRDEPLSRATPVPREEAERLVMAQHPRVRQAWALLNAGSPQGKQLEGSGTDAWARADFLVALCLIQHGYEVAAVAALLLELPGSKASVRGEPYAARTCERAAETARTGRLPRR